MSTRIERSITIDLPVRTVYDQWTQFEDFPLFMSDVEKVVQLTPTEVEWTVKMRGVERSWRATITEQSPDQRIAWKSVEGPDQAGVVTFHALNDDQTRVMYQMEFEPSGVLEHYADKVGLLEDRVEDDLEEFKTFIEKRGKATGGWRGEVSREAS